MSHSSYTSSERRGILVIAILALLLTGGGFLLSFWGRENKESDNIHVVVELTQMKDTVENNKIIEKKTKANKKQKSARKNNKTKKNYPRRSPLDEPV